MKIAYLVSFAPSFLAEYGAERPPRGGGGAEFLTFKVGEEIQKKGHKVTLISRHYSNLPLFEEKGNYKIYRIRTINIPFLRTFFYIFSVFSLLRSIRPDIVSGQGALQNGFMSSLWGRISPAISLIHVMGSDVNSSPDWYKKTILRLSLIMSDKTIVLNQGLKQKVNNIQTGLDLFIVPVGAELDRFNFVNKQKARKELKYKSDENLIIFVGRLTESKGVKYLILAFKKLLSNIPNTHLIIVGDGEQKNALVRMSKKLSVDNKIDFIGYLESDQIPLYLIASDLFVLPSMSEGFPLVIVEAFAASLPVVITNAWDSEFLFQDGHNGFVVEPKDSYQLYDSIFKIMTNDSLYDTISNNNKTASTNYSWEKISNNLEEIYLGVEYKNA